MRKPELSIRKCLKGSKLENEIGIFACNSRTQETYFYVFDIEKIPSREKQDLEEPFEGRERWKEQIDYFLKLLRFVIVEDNKERDKIDIFAVIYPKQTYFNYYQYFVIYFREQMKDALKDAKKGCLLAVHPWFSCMNDYAIVENDNSRFFLVPTDEKLFLEDLWLRTLCSLNKKCQQEYDEFEIIDKYDINGGRSYNRNNEVNGQKHVKNKKCLIF